MSKNVYFTVGPSKLYPTVEAHLKEALESDIPSISHRGAVFMPLYEKTITDLKRLMSVPVNYEIFFTGSGTEGMERGIQNCVAKKSGHVMYGSFSKRWNWVSKSLGRETEEFSAPFGEIPDLAKVQFSQDVELIGITQNETSTGGALQPEAIAGLSARYPDAFIGVDIVSSAPVVQLDWSKIDFAFFSVQKGFGLPAGLGLIVISPRAFAKAGEIAKTSSIGSYHNFPELKKYAERKQTPETPSVLLIYLLGKVVEDMLAVGLPSIQKSTEAKAKKLYDFLKRQKVFSPFVKDANGQSLTTIAVEVAGGSKPVIEALKAEGLVVGAGYGERKEKDIRIANFPSHTEADFDRLIAALATYT